MQTQQQKFTQPPVYGVTFPEGEKPRVSLFSRDSLTRACRGNERMASVLDYFLYEGSWEIDRQKLPEGCKVVEFTRKHADILKRLTFQLSRKSLIGFLDIFNDWKFVGSEKYHNHYKVDFDAVQAAIDNPPAPKERKPRTRKGCKVEAITTEDTTSTLLQKVEELQRNVELLQPYVEEVQRLRCTCSTLQRDFSALVETLQGQSSEEHILLNYPLLSSLYQESAFTSVHAPLAPSDFLPEEIDEDDRPTEHRTPAITLNGATTHDTSLTADLQSRDARGVDTLHRDVPLGGNGTLAIASIPDAAADPPTAAIVRQSYTTPKSRVLEGHEQHDGAATMGTGEPRASDESTKHLVLASQATLQLQAASVTAQNGAGARQRKGKKVTQAELKTPEEEAFDARCSDLQKRINTWRGYELVKQGAIINERRCNRKLVEMFTDDEIECIHEYLFTRHWRYSKPDNRYTIGGYIMLEEGKNVLQILKDEKKPALSPEKPLDKYTANSLNKEKMAKRIEEMKARAALKGLQTQQGGVN